MPSKVRVIQLKTATFDSNLERSSNDSLEDQISSKSVLLTKAIATALYNISQNSSGGKSSTKPDVTFVTAPEFYWNIPWSSIKSKTDLALSCTFYLENINKTVLNLSAQFPEDIYGKIVFIPGSVAVLFEQEGRPNHYEVLNWLLCFTNFSPEGVINMWPKRNTSAIDVYFGQRLQDAGKGSDYYRTWLPNKLELIYIAKQTDVSAENYSADGTPDIFRNDISGVPIFAIDVCLDFALASARNQQRSAENKVNDIKLNFLIACGMPASSSDLEKVARTSIDYLIRNDGMGRGTSEVFNTTVANQVATVPAEYEPAGFAIANSDSRVFVYEFNV